MKFATLFIVSALSGSVSMGAQTAVWIDTDPSVARGGHEVDDGFALLQAFRSPELAIRGISVVFGNAPLTVAWPIAQRLVSDFGPVGTHLYRGAAFARERGQETDASRALAEALAREKLTILAIGPATNVATVLELHPELARRMTRVIAVAGRRRRQRLSARLGGPAFRDFNFEMDPAAFQTVLDSGVPLVLAGWEVSSSVWLREPDLARIRTANPRAGWILDAAEDWLALWKRTSGVEAFNPFDTLAVGYVAHPAGFSCESLPVRIETAPDDTVATGGKNKPYLIVDAGMKSPHSAVYCYRPPDGFAERLVASLCGKH